MDWRFLILVSALAIALAFYLIKGDYSTLTGLTNIVGASVCSLIVIVGVVWREFFLRPRLVNVKFDRVELVYRFGKRVFVPKGKMIWRTPQKEFFSNPDGGLVLEGQRFPALINKTILGSSESWCQSSNSPHPSSQNFNIHPGEFYTWNRSIKRLLPLNSGIMIIHLRGGFAGLVPILALEMRSISCGNY